MISANDYKEISDGIGVFWGSEKYLRDRVIDINDIVQANPYLLLVGSFDSGYSVLLTSLAEDSYIHYIYHDQPLFDAVRALQLHVLDTYSSIDDFLSAKDITVHNKFGELSNYLGFSISRFNYDWAIIYNGDTVTWPAGATDREDQYDFMGDPGDTFTFAYDTDTLTIGFVDASESYPVAGYDDYDLFIDDPPFAVFDEDGGTTQFFMGGSLLEIEGLGALYDESGNIEGYRLIIKHVPLVF